MPGGLLSGENVVKRGTGATPGRSGTRNPVSGEMDEHNVIGLYIHHRIAHNQLVVFALAEVVALTGLTTTAKMTIFSLHFSQAKVSRGVADGLSNDLRSTGMGYCL